MQQLKNQTQQPTHTHKMPSLRIIAAMDLQGGIGLNGTLPWHSRSEMRHFYATTTTAPAGKINAVIMGRRTWESLPKRLEKRINIVVSRSTPPGVRDGVLWTQSLAEALKSASAFGDVHAAFVIGGTELFRDALARPDLEECIISLFNTDAHADTFFPLDAAEQAGWGRLNAPPQNAQWVQDEGNVSFVVIQKTKGDGLLGQQTVQPVL